MSKRERERESSSRLILSSTSLAEEARGWVNSHSKTQAKSATASEYAIPSLRASRKTCVAIHRSKRKYIDCHANASAFARKTRRSRSFFSNDEFSRVFTSVKDTHPQTPLVLREGAFEVANSAVCHTEGVARSISNHSSICHNEALAEVSQEKSNRDISLALNMTKSTNVQNPLDISVSTKPQYDKVNICAKPQYNNKISQSAFILLTRKLAKSLLGIGLASGICANTAMAICTFVENNATSTRDVRCEGAITSGFTGSDLSGKAFLTTITQTTQYRTTNYYIGNANTYSYIVSPSRIIAYFKKNENDSTDRRHNVRFLNVSAPNTWFDFRNEKSGADAPITLSVEVGAGAVVGRLILTGNMETLSVFGSGAYLGRLESGSSSSTTTTTTIKTQLLGERTTINGVEQGVGNALLGSNNIGIKVERLELDGISLNINSSGAVWNDPKNNPTTREQHLSFSTDSLTTHNVKPQSIIINIGQGAQKGVEYKYKNLILKGDSGLAGINGTHITAGQGVRLTKGSDGFFLQADVSTSQGSSVYRALALSYMRRSVMTQNILDTMTTKTFHSDRYYEQEAQLKALKEDMGRLTNSSKRFSKLTRSKNQDSIDKVRQKVAKLTLEQSRAQNLKKYNNFELIDQLDAMFIPYDGRRDNRVFVLPYSAHSYADMGSSNAIEWVGGTLVGLQRNLRAAGIIGGYVGYEFVNTSTKLLGQDTKIQTNALQAGMHYFKSFAFRKRAWEGFIKGNIRGGVDFPQFSMQVAGQSVKLTSASSASKVPLMWSVGAEMRTGITFYQYKYNSYVAPEIGVSYDLLSSIDMAMKKPVQIGADELHNAISWHLPQASFSVRYYKMWGEMFRTSFKAGVRYNIFSTQRARFSIGAFDDNGVINLPIGYGNLALDFIWLIRKNHELSLGYDGLFYANKFDKGAEDRFNGITTTLNLKYAYWFGSKAGATPSIKSKKPKSTKKEKKPKEPKKEAKKESKKDAKAKKEMKKEAKKKAESKAKSNKKDTKKNPKKSK